MMTTYSGRFIDPCNIASEDIDIIDIAHALSMLCRFGGHTQYFYSVAEHSLLVAAHCHPEHRLWGLLHDAAEAYLGDVIRPVKMRLDAYRKMESRVADAIAARFALARCIPPEVVHADSKVLDLELRALFGAPGAPKDNKRPPISIGTPSCMAPADVRSLFLKTFSDLTGEPAFNEKLRIQANSTDGTPTSESTPGKQA